ncbi:MAG TPA: hypothetical protein VKB93_00675 [Thermoanaerobaculia bacterium]|nr:hypothetical protein [Thermoanaerobaculia bacterium]
MNEIARPTRIRTSLFVKAAAAAIVFMGAVRFLAWFIVSHPDSRWTPFAATLPIVAVAIVIAAAMSSLKGMDEREARMHLEALAFAFLASQLVLCTYAFMAYAGLVRMQLEMFMPMMVLLWVAGLARSLWKYR